MRKVNSPFSNIFTKNLAFIGLLIFMILATSIGIIFAKHKNRILHAKLQGIYVQKDFLNKEWTQLLLEHATWTSAMRVEKIAREKLEMILPKKTEIIKP